MSERSPVLLLEDILEACERILEYTRDLTYEDFRKNYLVVDAVIRNFAIIGEAAGRISTEFRDNHNEIEWNRLSELIYRANERSAIRRYSICSTRFVPDGRY